MTGNELRALREKKKLTQAGLAAKLGYAHYQRIVELEGRGKKEIGKQALWKLRAVGLVK
jgi:transcriptional regulator with XRE-family HTH domain